MSFLRTTLIDGKRVTHVHNGNGHFFCGDSDDADTIDVVAHKKPTCKDCIKVLSDTAAIAKKYGIK